ncbi:MAG: hypothetical protein D6680_03505 [Cyanobacteria bacterium J007]|nr:MAG: hypothetical protein D6680_03505 [Cyanobacteria bacterium J007]
MPRTSNTAAFDFDDDKFQAPPSEIMPWCQIVNPRYTDNGMTPFGFAISAENATNAGFTPDENWQHVEYEFGDGEIKDLYLTTTPKVIVVRRGPVCIKYRETGELVGRLGDYYDMFMANKVKFKTFTRHLVFLVGEDKKFLHPHPLRLSVSGAAGASFGSCYRLVRSGETPSGFTVELEKAYASFRNQPYVAKNFLFHAHGIYCPFIEAVEKGMGENTALVATTTDYEHPTASNLIDYLIPSNSKESEIICNAFEEYQNFGQDIPKMEEPPKETTPDDGNAYVYEDEFDYAEPPY